MPCPIAIMLSRSQGRHGQVYFLRCNSQPPAARPHGRNKTQKTKQVRAGCPPLSPMPPVTASAVARLRNHGICMIGPPQSRRTETTESARSAHLNLAARVSSMPAFARTRKQYGGPLAMGMALPLWSTMCRLLC